MTIDEKNKIIIDTYNELVQRYQAIVRRSPSKPVLCDTMLRESIDAITNDWNILSDYIRQSYPYNITDLEDFAKILKEALKNSISAALNPQKDRLSSETFFMSTRGYKAMVFYIQTLNQKYSDPKIHEILISIESNVKAFASTIFNNHTKQSITSRDVRALGNEIDTAFQVSDTAASKAPIFGPGRDPDPKSLFYKIKEYLELLLRVSNQSSDSSNPKTNGIVSYKGGIPFPVTFSTEPFDSVLELFEQLEKTLSSGADLSDLRSTPIYKNFRESFDGILSSSSDRIRTFYFDKWKRSIEQEVKSAMDLIIKKFPEASTEEKQRLLEYVHKHFSSHKGSVTVNHIWESNDMQNIEAFVSILCGEAPSADPQLAYDGLVYLVSKALNGASFSDDQTKNRSTQIMDELRNNKVKIQRSLQGLMTPAGSI